MSKVRKAAERLSGTPTPSDIKWTELKSILEHLGYTELKNNGSRRKFFHSEKNALINLHQPHPSPNVGKKCIDNVVDHLRQHGFIK